MLFVRSNPLMELPVQITYRNMERSDAVTARIEAEAAKLDTFFDGITSCRVVVEAPRRHHKKGELFHVRIELRVPGAELVLSHGAPPHATLNREEAAAMSKHPEVHPVHKDVYVAVREAFVLARRQLQNYVKRLRGEVKTHQQDPRTEVRASAYWR
jgi:ribosome-associated translation inhibitor RaiA